MIRTASSICLAAIALSLAACASQPSVGDDWHRPFKETTVKPVLQHDMAIANPPYPRPHYLDYMDEPTRFVFRPRNVPVDATDDGSSDDQGQDNGMADTTGGVLQNGILYVDPNQ